jgi:hypothetical protein
MIVIVTFFYFVVGILVAAAIKDIGGTKWHRIVAMLFWPICIISGCVYSMIMLTIMVFED